MYCFVVSALRRAALIPSPSCSFDQRFFFAEGKATCFSFSFPILTFFLSFFIVPLWKKRRFSILIGGQRVYRPFYEQLLLPFSIFQCLLISRLSFYITVSLSLAHHTCIIMLYPSTIYLSLSLYFFLHTLCAYSGTHNCLYIMPLSFTQERNTQCNRVTSNSR